MKLQVSRAGALGAAVCVALACAPRVKTEGYGFCGTPDADSTPAGPVVSQRAGPPGEVRVIAARRPDGSQLYLVNLMGTTWEAATDSIAVLHAVPPGTYEVRVRAIDYEERRVPVELRSDSGLALVVPLRYLGRYRCEDGTRVIRRPWWKFW